MAGQSEGRSTGLLLTADRMNREFVAQLTVWGFVQRKVDGVHLVFRGPHGGTLRVVRSLLGRVDTHQVEKAARLIGVTTDRFWAGPGAPTSEPGPATSTSTEDAAPSRRPAERDRVTSLVLALHAAEDRPLGFDQVVQLAGGRVTREQVRTASAHLCREGDLDRIRSGVYQWSNGVRAPQSTTPTSTAAAPLPVAPPVPAEVTRISATQLFDQLFPAGVHMTAALFAEFERWTELTEELARHAQAS